MTDLLSGGSAFFSWVSITTVIARAKPVAISWYCVYIRTWSLEIATPLRARNDMVWGDWAFWGK